MSAEASMNFHDAALGALTKGIATSPQSAEPVTTVAVSSNESPPGAALSSAFQPACRRPAASTASVTPSVRWSGCTSRLRRSGFDGRQCGIEYRECPIELVRGDDERRGKGEHVALPNFERETVRQAVVHHPFRFGVRGLAVADELE